MSTLKIYDIAGLVKGASEGQGLGNAFLSHISGVDGLYHVVRAFDDKHISHDEGSIDPCRDIETIHKELGYKDLAMIKRIQKDLEVKFRGNKDDRKKVQFEIDVIKRCRELIETELKWIKDENWNTEAVEILNQYYFLTSKPVIYLVNVSVQDFLDGKNKYINDIKDQLNFFYGTEDQELY